MKSILSTPLKIALALAFILLQNFASFAYDFQAEGFNFAFIGSSNKVALLSQISPSQTVIIPSKVTFRGKEFVVATIGAGAFRGSNITNVTFSEGLEVIGDNAFRGSSITNVTFSEGLKEIGNNAFQNTNIEKLILPHSNTHIGEYAFADCPNLKYVQFGKSLISSGYWRTLRHTFANDDNIETIIFTSERPPQNLYDYPPFSDMTRQFCKVYYPINGHLHYMQSALKRMFANELIPYAPKGVETETVPYVRYVWNQDSVASKYVIKGTYFEDRRPYASPDTDELTLIIEECPRKDHNLVKITLDGLDGDWGSKYAVMPKSANYTNFECEDWLVSDCDEDPIRRKATIKFETVKTKVWFKTKLHKAVTVEVTRDNHVEVKPKTFIITEIPESFNVDFTTSD